MKNVTAFNVPQLHTYGFIVEGTHVQPYAIMDQHWLQVELQNDASCVLAGHEYSQHELAKLVMVSTHMGAIAA